MQITILAVGRMKSGPESELVRDYIERFNRTGRAHGLGPAELREIEDRKGGGQEAEIRLLLDAIPAKSYVYAMDERGQAMKSPKFSDQLCALRDDGQRSVTFVIGGADGLTDAFRTKANRLLSFGPMVWPHMLARAMLSEQLYRAASIVAGSPYHRE